MRIPEQVHVCLGQKRRKEIHRSLVYKVSFWQEQTQILKYFFRNIFTKIHSNKIDLLNFTVSNLRESPNSIVYRKYFAPSLLAKLTFVCCSSNFCKIEEQITLVCTTLGFSFSSYHLTSIEPTSLTFKTFLSNLYSYFKIDCA
jgi:hypothetical protein